MIEVKEGRDFQIQDYGDRIELTTNLAHGLIGGIEYLIKNDYQINYDAYHIVGHGMHVVPATKKELTKEEANQQTINTLNLEDKETEIKALKEEIKTLKTENRTSKSTITRLKNKTKKLEK